VKETVEVRADGEGFCSQAGALLLTNLCDRLGLTEALGQATAHELIIQDTRNPTPSDWG
jgi:hypothetical protein